MFTFAKDSNELFYDERKIYSAPGPLYKILTDIINDCAILIYWPQEFYPKDKEGFTINASIQDKKLKEVLNQNVLLIDKTGNIKWRIGTDTDYPASYISVQHKDNKFIAFRGDDLEFDLDIHTGEISNPKYVK